MANKSESHQVRAKLTPMERHVRHLEAARSYYARNKERLREEHRLRMKERRAKARESKNETNEGSSNPPNLPRPQCNICNHCGQIIDARRLKFKEVQQDSSM